ncbi:MAG: hypothetical protein GY750_19035 [Lentisphaerae bacterium]|nr:hypothetical protein [Lentisphaerota bacterium]
MKNLKTVRLRTAKTRGQGNAKMTMAMGFKLIMEASKRYMKLKGYKLIPQIMQGLVFKDGEIQEKAA